MKMNEIIGKIQSKFNNYRIEFLYYKRARDAMLDVVSMLYDRGYKNIFIPGYIGWSPREGSGIFDPLEKINGLNRHYYRMNRYLHIDKKSIDDQLTNKSILLIVNYFGFRDPSIKVLIKTAHERNCIVLEDNAHGFYTYFSKGSVGADATFFSLHKMFPFVEGGGLIVDNLETKSLHNIITPIDFNPFQYNYNEIARIRIENYKALLQLSKGKENYFIPFRNESYLVDNIPQTFPILIKMGDRNKIYEIMNNAGFGVVSLYHTMIDELRTEEYSEALWISKRIMNLPVHQDVDRNKYIDMVKCLVDACEETK